MKTITFYEIDPQKVRAFVKSIKARVIDQSKPLSPTKAFVYANGVSVGRGDLGSGILQDLMSHTFFVATVSIENGELLVNTGNTLLAHQVPQLGMKIWKMADLDREQQLQIKKLQKAIKHEKRFSTHNERFFFSGL